MQTTNTTFVSLPHARFIAIFNGASYLYGGSLNGLFVDNIAIFYRSILRRTSREAMTFALEKV